MVQKVQNPEISRMVGTISRQFDPDRIILFGSHANGTATSDSDVDLLVVMPVQGSVRRKAMEIDRALSDRKIPLDILVVTPEKFMEGQRQIGSVIRPAASEGIVMYDRSIN